MLLIFLFLVAISSSVYGDHDEYPVQEHYGHDQDTMEETYDYTDLKSQDYAEDLMPEDYAEDYKVPEGAYPLIDAGHDQKENDAYAHPVKDSYEPEVLYDALPNVDYELKGKDAYESDFIGEKYKPIGDYEQDVKDSYEHPVEDSYMPTKSDEYEPDVKEDSYMPSKSVEYEPMVNDYVTDMEEYESEEKDDSYMPNIDEYEPARNDYTVEDSKKADAGYMGQLNDIEYEEKDDSEAYIESEDADYTPVSKRKEQFKAELNYVEDVGDSVKDVEVEEEYADIVSDYIGAPVRTVAADELIKTLPSNYVDPRPAYSIPAPRAKHQFSYISAPQYASPQYAAPHYVAPQYAAPHYASPQYFSPPMYSGHSVEYAPEYAPYSAPEVHYVSAPEVHYVGAPQTYGMPHGAPFSSYPVYA